MMTSKVLITDMERCRRSALKPGLPCLLAGALLAAGCERRDMTREEAVAAVEAYIRGEDKRETYPRDKFPRVAYERRSSWLVHYMSDGGAGGPPTVELDKKSGKVLLVTGGQ